MTTTPTPKDAPDTTKKISILSDPRVIAFLLFLLSGVIYLLCSKREFNWYNNYSYLADALLHGHIDVPNIPDYLESVAFRGHTYMHFAPGGAWISLPFVALFGIEGFNCAYLTLFLGAVDSALAYLALEQLKLGKSIRSRIVLTLMLTIGTVHFYCSSLGGSWQLGHISTMFFLLLSWNFLFSVKSADTPKGYLRIFLCGLFFGLAVCCRLSALLGAVFILYYIYTIYRFDIKAYLSFCCGAAIFGSLYMLYNFVRFGTIMDEGYSLTYLKDYHREVYNQLQNAPLSEQRRLFKAYKKECGGPLQLKFVSYNLYSILMMAPTFSHDFPYLIPELTGVAITFTSPMLYLAVTARQKKGIVIALWISAIATAIPFMMNYGNGMGQFGMRYSLDFTPYLWLLMCLGLGKTKLRWWMIAGFIFCFASNLWGALYWKFYY